MDDESESEDKGVVIDMVELVAVAKDVVVVVVIGLDSVISGVGVDVLRVVSAIFEVVVVDNENVSGVDVG